MTSQSYFSIYHLCRSGCQEACSRSYSSFTVVRLTIMPAHDCSRLCQRSLSSSRRRRTSQYTGQYTRLGRAGTSVFLATSQGSAKVGLKPYSRHVNLLTLHLGVRRLQLDGAARRRRRTFWPKSIASKLRLPERVSYMKECKIPRNKIQPKT